MTSKEPPDKFFSSFNFYIIDLNIIKAQMKIFESKIKSFGGRMISGPTAKEEITHILVDDNLSNENITKIISTKFPDFVSSEEKKSDVEILRTKWLFGCIKEKKLIDTKPFEVELKVKKAESDRDSDSGHSQERQKETRKRHSSNERNRNSSGERISDDDKATVYNLTTDSEDSEDGFRFKSIKKADGLSAPDVKRAKVGEPSDAIIGADEMNYNQLITDKLKILADGYKAIDDKWRALSYERAISTLKHYPKPISSFEEVRKLRGIGQRLAEKIWEIHETGDLRKANQFLHDDKIQAMNLFTNIFGVGPAIAHQWYAQGMRTLKDVEERVDLTAQQRIGLKYYDEFLQKMDRSEATQILEMVEKTLKEICPEVIYEACGSYRRKRPKCGDVDFLFTHPDGRSHELLLSPLVKQLTDIGLLTDHLVECAEEERHRKYMGVCKLPGEGHLHRRIDLIAVPYEEFRAAVLAWTGHVLFVRSIFGKAKKMGMRLNAHGLRGGVMRQGGEKLNDGYLIPTPTEESIFEKLEIPYVTPEKRETVILKY